MLVKLYGHACDGQRRHSPPGIIGIGGGIHKTPAMAAGVADHVWRMEEARGVVARTPLCDPSRQSRPPKSASSRRWTIPHLTAKMLCLVSQPDDPRPDRKHELHLTKE